MIHTVARRVLKLLGLSHKYTKREMLTLYKAGLITADEAKTLARFSLRHEGITHAKIEHFINGELTHALNKATPHTHKRQRKQRRTRHAKKHSRSKKTRKRSRK